MDAFYLDNRRREFYDAALSHIRACGDERWDLDEGLDGHIDFINVNDKVRTMYSRKGPNQLGSGMESYLYICYTRDVEDKIKNEVVPSLISSFANMRNCDFAFRFEAPQVNLDEGEVSPCQKYIEHRDYWNVFNVKFELKGGNSGQHEEFWSILSTTLSRL
jgi:hypothetical protein